MELKGKVISTKMQKTAVVSVERFVTHPIYKKRTKQSKNYKVHDEIGVSVGDFVKIAATRPISKDKHFRITEVIKK